VALTFDDGYADNLYAAKPLLEKFNIPATMFVASGHIGHEREFWWDELEKIILIKATLPKTLSLAIDGQRYHWELDESGEFGSEKHHRQPLFYSIHKLLQPLHETERNIVMDELLAWAETNPVRRSTHRTLSLEELHTLNQGTLIEVGAHTVTHPFLSTLSNTMQRKEIQFSKSLLEDSIGQPVRSFSYPYGNYGLDTVALVREAGYDCACSIVNDRVWSHSNPFLLPRIPVNNWDGEEFSKRLSQF
jgi:peptidoglycan/xylan/chitin deacetylase (PgdA/CDA1 family)